MGLLSGKNEAPQFAKDAKKLIGCKVEFLRHCDIDKSGRGYFFPRVGVVEGVYGRNLLINGDYVSFSELSELIVLS